MESIAKYSISHGLFLEFSARASILESECMVKIVCQVCGVIGYLQHIGKNYYRVRHYVGYENGKPVFKYHRQDPEYVKDLLEKKKVDQIGHNDIDQNLKVKEPFNENKRAGSLVRIGRKPPKLAVVGSNPTPPAIEIGVLSLRRSFLLFPKN